MGLVKYALQKYSDYESVVTPVSNEAGLWISMQFKYDARSTNIVCSSWEVLDCFGAVISLNSLTYKQFVEIGDALAEELQFHYRSYYDDLANDYYSNVGMPIDRLEET